MATLKLYGVPFSQPVRAVIWLLLLKRMPFELVLTNPGTKGESGSRHPDYLAKNPMGTIPCIEEPETGFTLGEAHAIMPYLAQTHGWSDLYPDDLRARARVDWYLHLHHRNVREASGLVAPKIRKDLNFPEAVIQSSMRNISNALHMLNDYRLVDGGFVAGDQITIADLAAYVEIGQLQPQFTNVFDFAPFPNVVRWLNDMAAVAFHDEVHVVLSELGDVSKEAPSMDAIRNANKSALRTLKETQANL
jgi:glutathione S-transferase